MYRFITATCAALLAAAVAQAQEPAFAAQMREVNARVPAPAIPLVAADALITLQAIAKQHGHCAPSSVTLDGLQPATADRLAIQGIQSGQLRNGWTATGKTSGCAGAPPVRFIVLQLADGSVRALMVNAGHAVAWPSLIRDTSVNAAIVAIAAIKRANASCDDNVMPEMIETRLAGKPVDLSPDFYGVRYRGHWEEAWTFGACGRNAEVTVAFDADDQGGAYSHIKSDGVRLLDR